MVNKQKVYKAVSLNEFMTDEYETFYQGYLFRIEKATPKIDPENAAVDVILTTRSGEVYAANFATLRFIEYMFEKNKRTGECVSGSYFCMPRLVIVERIDEEKIKKTIDDLIKNRDIEEYFM